jgi:hypothetical protein
MDHPDAFEAVRNGLAPPKERILTPEQTEGARGLAAFEAARKAQLAVYSAQEAELMKQLADVRARKNAFGQAIAAAIPAYGLIKTARRATLTNAERCALLNRRSGDETLSERFTEEGLLAAARQNKIAASERELLCQFRGFRDETHTQNVVATAIRAAAGDAAAAQVPVETGAEDVSLDDLL